jgi:hypothetical protein
VAELEKARTVVERTVCPPAAQRRAEPADRLADSRRAIIVEWTAAEQYQRAASSEHGAAMAVKGRPAAPEL